MPLLKIIIDGKEEVEASQYGVMNWTCKVALGVRRYTVHDKLAMSGSRYFPYNQYMVTKTLLRPASLYNRRVKTDRDTNSQRAFSPNTCRPELQTAT